MDLNFKLSSKNKLVPQISQIFFCSILIAGLFTGPGISYGENASTGGGIQDLKKLSLDELLNQEVTVVSRRAESLSQSPSAVQVITGEEIKRSGAMTLADALRLAPNLQVAQINSHDFAISARGFNQPGGLSDKLLVMIDGRTVYTPLFAGVFWDAQSVLLEDIDRIEVVSGPGASLWGANAVNGVINVLTKSAKDSQGTYVSVGAGSFVQDTAAFRYGDKIGSNLFFRIYGQRLDQNGMLAPNGHEATNSWDTSQGGFRMDWLPNQADTLTVQGDIYSGTEQNIPRNTTLDGQNLLSRWTHSFGEESELTVQGYFDRTWRLIPGAFAEDLKTYDLDLQYRISVGERQSWLFGAGYRLMNDEVSNFPAGSLAFLPADYNMQLLSGFFQDEITILPDRLKLTLGTKIEHNDFSGTEVQPSIRLSYQATKNQTIWTALSRSVRSPSRIDRDYHIPGTAPYFLDGGPSFRSEKSLAYELGYRVEPIQKLSISAASFFNLYNDIRSVELVNPATSTYQIENGLRGQSWGVELSGRFQATEWWRLKAGYTFIHEHIRQKRGHVDLSLGRGEANDPQHQFTLQSIVNLPAGFQFDLTGRYVDSLPFPAVPAYVTLDARLAWEFRNKLEIALIGQNLGGPHAEFGDVASRYEVPRSIFGKVTWRF